MMKPKKAAKDLRCAAHRSFQHACLACQAKRGYQIFPCGCSVQGGGDLPAHCPQHPPVARLVLQQVTDALVTVYRSMDSVALNADGATVHAALQAAGRDPACLCVSGETHHRAHCPLWTVK